MKKCSGCKIEKELEDFGVSKRQKDGLQQTCKACAKAYRDANKERQKEYNAVYQNDPANKAKAKVVCRKNYESKQTFFIAEARKHYKENKSTILEKAKLYYIENKETINPKKTKRALERLKTDPLYKLSSNVRTLIRNVIRNSGHQKKSKTVDILGCSIENFKLHLEKQFDEHMTWENQGSYWHMDHIKPVSLAKYETDIIELNHYTNFQPLEKYENLSKSNKYPYIK